MKVQYDESQWGRVLHSSKNNKKAKDAEKYFHQMVVQNTVML